MYAVSVRDLGKNETVEIPQRFLDLVDKIFDEAHFAREEGEIIAVQLSEVGVLQVRSSMQTMAFLHQPSGKTCFSVKPFSVSTVFAA
jgi:hypothetical protein